MARLSGVTIPDKKPIFIALTAIYGIGETSSRKILKEANVDPKKRTDSLQADEFGKIKEIIEKRYKVEGDLRREIMLQIKRLRDIGSWRGMRHAKRLPVRGQRTRTNTRTIRGNVRRTVTSGKKPAPTPT